jgi:O-antigen/teichoic acid export membrane protein
MSVFSKSVTQLAKGAGLAVFGKFAGRLLAVLGDIVAARVLGPSLFGLYAIGWTLLRIIGLLAHLGLPTGVLRYIPRYADDKAAVKNLINRSILIVAAVGVIVGGILYFGAPWLASNLYQKPLLTGIIRLFAFIIPLMSLLTLLSSISRSMQNMIYSVSVEDIGQPLLGLVLVVCIYLFAGPWLTGVILSDLVSYLVTGIICFFIVRKLFYSILITSGSSRVRISEVLAFSVPTALAGTFAVFVFWVDRLLVGYFLPASENGIYQAVSQISVLFVLVIAAFNAILAPIFADLHSRRDVPQMQETYRVGTKWGLYISIPFFLVFCFAPAETLMVLYGAEYAGGWIALLVLTMGQLVNVATGSVGTLLSMAGYQRAWLGLSSAALVLNILLCVLLIPRFGIMGAAIATSVSLSVMNFTGIIKAWFSLGVWPYDLRYLKGMFAAFCCLLVLGVLRIFYHGSALPFLSISTLLAVLVFFGLIILQGLDDEDRNLLGLLRARILKE